jgi:hypothetical protein
MTLAQAVNQAVDVINLAVQVLGTVALVLFLWSVVRYITTSTEKDQRESREAMVWGIIALFVLVSIWGILRIMKSVFPFG